MRIRPIFLAILLVALTAIAAHAGVPDPRNCTADTCLMISPAGLFTYKVVMRDESAAPVADLPVVLDFGTAGGVNLCDSSDPDHNRRVVVTTDATGSAVFNVRGGGQTTGYVVVSAIGQVVVIAHVRSTDLNGDLAVNSADATLFSGIPSNSNVGDYNCDGLSNSADLAILNAQLGQDCNTVPVLDFTWGAIKGYYR